MTVNLSKYVNNFDIMIMDDQACQIIVEHNLTEQLSGFGTVFCLPEDAASVSLSSSSSVLLFLASTFVSDVKLPGSPKSMGLVSCLSQQTYDAAGKQIPPSCALFDFVAVPVLPVGNRCLRFTTALHDGKTPTHQLYEVAQKIVDWALRQNVSLAGRCFAACNDRGRSRVVADTVNRWFADHGDGRPPATVVIADDLFLDPATDAAHSDCMLDRLLDIVGSRIPVAQVFSSAFPDSPQSDHLDSVFIPLFASHPDLLHAAMHSDKDSDVFRALLSQTDGVASRARLKKQVAAVCQSDQRLTAARDGIAAAAVFALDPTNARATDYKLAQATENAMLAELDGSLDRRRQRNGILTLAVQRLAELAKTGRQTAAAHDGIVVDEGRRLLVFAFALICELCAPDPDQIEEARLHLRAASSASDFQFNVDALLDPVEQGVRSRMQQQQQQSLLLSGRPGSCQLLLRPPAAVSSYWAELTHKLLFMEPGSDADVSPELELVTASESGRSAAAAAVGGTAGSLFSTALSFGSSLLTAATGPSVRPTDTQTILLVSLNKFSAARVRSIYRQFSQSPFAQSNKRLFIASLNVS